MQAGWEEERRLDQSYSGEAHGVPPWKRKLAVHAEAYWRLMRGKVVEDVADCVAIGSKSGFVATVALAVGVHGVGVAGGGDDGVEVVGLADLGLGMEDQCRERPRVSAMGGGGRVGRSLLPAES